ncbi:MAG: DUF424 family protein [Sulfolobales archaeon]|nr:DUF424 family protein [Sulfolobales archaeon]MDW8082243.1 DUF424 family protein [Sulfolobales archaeon]
MRVYVKVIEVDEGGVVRRITGMCDEELLGKAFRDGDLVLEVNEEFFGGSVVELDEALAIAESSESVMAVGERIISKLIHAKLVHPLAVNRIAGIPYSFILRY